MRSNEWFHIRLLLKRLGILVVLYALCRILFFQFNKDLFPDLELRSFLSVMWFGFRFDLASIIYINLLFILLHVVPNPWRETLRYQQVIKLIFYAFNGVALMMESGDFIYFRYGLKRTSTHELGLTNDAAVLPMVIQDFWFIFLLVLVLTLLVEWLYRKTEFVKRRAALPAQRLIHYPTQIILMVIILGAGFIGARGGLQEEPISPSQAGELVQNEQLSELVINTPYSVLYAFGHRRLRDPGYLPDDRMDSLYSPYHAARQLSTNTDKKNICIIVLESFSKEYIGYFNNGAGYTPFLDSLMGQGQVFTNFYANGKSSNQGIIAINSGIPVLMEEPFISSLYKENSFNGLGSLLQQQGYFSAFFHGANNGSMGFDKFLQRAGFNAYYGRNEFNDDSYFDGNWGIFDEPFLQYTAREMTQLPQPFLSEIFTISSHHPYTLPKEYQGVFPKGEIPMMEVVGYSDHALRQFFATASQQPWFSETLFILTADHNGLPAPSSAFYKNQIGAHSTWMLLYHPNGDYSGSTDMVAQQTDIFASVLDYAGYEGPYFGFGQSVWHTTDTRLAFGFHAGTYRIIYKDTALFYSGNEIDGLYQFPDDSLLTYDLQQTAPATLLFMEDRLKAIIQSHHRAMMYNRLTAQ